MADVEIGDQYGYIDKTGKLIIQPQFYAADYFHEGLAVVRYKYEGPSGVIDKTGKVVIEAKKWQISAFDSGFATFTDKSTEKEGIIDRQGRVVIEPTFKNIHLLHSGIFRAETEQGFEFINEKHRVIWKSE